VDRRRDRDRRFPVNRRIHDFGPVPRNTHPAGLVAILVKLFSPTKSFGRSSGLLDAVDRERIAPSRPRHGDVLTGVNTIFA